MQNRLPHNSIPFTEKEEVQYREGRNHYLESKRHYFAFLELAYEDLKRQEGLEAATAHLKAAFECIATLPPAHIKTQRLKLFCHLQKANLESDGNNDFEVAEIHYQLAIQYARQCDDIPNLTYCCQVLVSYYEEYARKVEKENKDADVYYDKAIKYCKQFATKQEQEAYTQLLQGRKKSQRHKLSAAERRATEVDCLMVLAYSSPISRFREHHLLSALRIDSALRVDKEEESSSYPFIRFHLALVYLEIAQESEEHDQIIENCEKAIEQLTHLIKWDPKLAIHYFMQAEAQLLICLNNGSFEEGEALEEPLNVIADRIKQGTDALNQYPNHQEMKWVIRDVPTGITAEYLKEKVSHIVDSLLYANKLLLSAHKAVYVLKLVDLQILLITGLRKRFNNSSFKGLKVNSLAMAYRQKALAYTCIFPRRRSHLEEAMKAGQQALSFVTRAALKKEIYFLLAKIYKAKGEIKKFKKHLYLTKTIEDNTPSSNAKTPTAEPISASLQKTKKRKNKAKEPKPSIHQGKPLTAGKEEEKTSDLTAQPLTGAYYHQLLQQVEQLNNSDSSDDLLKIKTLNRCVDLAEMVKGYAAAIADPSQDDSKHPSMIAEEDQEAKDACLKEVPKLLKTIYEHCLVLSINSDYEKYTYYFNRQLFDLLNQERRMSFDKEYYAELMYHLRNMSSLKPQLAIHELEKSFVVLRRFMSMVDEAGAKFSPKDTFSKHRPLGIVFNTIENAIAAFDYSLEEQTVLEKVGEIELRVQPEDASKVIKDIAEYINEWIPVLEKRNLAHLILDLTAIQKILWEYLKKDYLEKRFSLYEKRMRLHLALSEESQDHLDDCIEEGSEALKFGLTDDEKLLLQDLLREAYLRKGMPEKCETVAALQDPLGKQKQKASPDKVAPLAHTPSLLDMDLIQTELGEHNTQVMPTKNTQTMTGTKLKKVKATKNAQTKEVTAKAKESKTALKFKEKTIAQKPSLDEIEQKKQEQAELQKLCAEAPAKLAEFKKRVEQTLAQVTESHHGILQLSAELKRIANDDSKANKLLTRADAALSAVKGQQKKVEAMTLRASSQCTLMEMKECLSSAEEAVNSAPKQINIIKTVEMDAKRILAEQKESIEAREYQSNLQKEKQATENLKKQKRLQKRKGRKQAQRKSRQASKVDSLQNIQAPSVESPLAACEPQQKQEEEKPEHLPPVLSSPFQISEQQKERLSQNLLSTVPLPLLNYLFKLNAEIKEQTGEKIYVSGSIVYKNGFGFHAILTAQDELAKQFVDIYSPDLDYYVKSRLVVEDDIVTAQNIVADSVLRIEEKDEGIKPRYELSFKNEFSNYKLVALLAEGKQMTIDTTIRYDSYKETPFVLIPLTHLKGTFDTEPHAHFPSITFGENRYFIIEDKDNLYGSAIKTRTYDIALPDPDHKNAATVTKLFYRAFHFMLRMKNHSAGEPLLKPGPNAKRLLDEKGEWAHYYFARQIFSENPGLIKNCWNDLEKLIESKLFFKEELTPILKAFFNAVLLKRFSPAHPEILQTVAKNSTADGAGILQLCAKLDIISLSTEMVAIFRAFFATAHGSGKKMAAVIKFLLGNPKVLSLTREQLTKELVCTFSSGLDPKKELIQFKQWGCPLSDDEYKKMVSLCQNFLQQSAKPLLPTADIDVAADKMATDLENYYQFFPKDKQIPIKNILAVLASDTSLLTREGHFIMNIHLTEVELQREHLIRTLYSNIHALQEETLKLYEENIQLLHGLVYQVISSQFTSAAHTVIPAENSKNPNKNNQGSKKVYGNGDNKSETNQQVEGLAGIAATLKPLVEKMCELILKLRSPISPLAPKAAENIMAAVLLKYYKASSTQVVANIYYLMEDLLKDLPVLGQGKMDVDQYVSLLHKKYGRCPSSLQLNTFFPLSSPHGGDNSPSPKTASSRSSSRHTIDSPAKDLSSRTSVDLKGTFLDGREGVRSAPPHYPPLRPFALQGMPVLLSPSPYQGVANPFFFGEETKKRPPSHHSLQSSPTPERDPRTPPPYQGIINTLLLADEHLLQPSPAREKSAGTPPSCQGVIDTSSFVKRPESDSGYYLQRPFPSQAGSQSAPPSRQGVIDTASFAKRPLSDSGHFLLRPSLPQAGSLSTPPSRQGVIDTLSLAKRPESNSGHNLLRPSVPQAGSSSTPPSPQGVVNAFSSAKRPETR